MIDIVIVNWNSGDQLRQIVESVCTHSGGLVSKLIIVDNHSSDQSLANVQKMNKRQGLEVQIIQNERNIGFGAACNLGAKQCSAPYLLFLNPDALLFEDTLVKVHGFMEEKSNASIGICGIQLVDEQGHVARTCARFPSAAHFVMGSLGLDRFPRWKKYSVHQFDWDHRQSKVVDHVIGAFYFMRTPVFKQLNGFDERFFVYLEDLDFSFRALQAGWLSYYHAGIQSFHKGGGTSEQIKAIRLFYSLRSKLQYAQKHLSLTGAILVWTVSLLIEPFIRIAYSIQKLSIKQLAETVSGYRKLYAWSLKSVVEPSNS